MKKNLLVIVIACAIAFANWKVFGLGSEYPNDRPVNEPSWPAGMSGLVNITNRIGGFFVNAEDVLFFSGTASDFNNFLSNYSKIQTIEKHQLILHTGAGEAYSLGGGNRRPCDWELYGCPKGWLNLRELSSQGTNSVEAMQQAGKDTNYVLQVHFWIGGKIDVNRLVVPSNVAFTGDCFRNFEAITNGMTRAEVEKKLKLDGGLRGASPVRFIDSSCPGFKINVKFDFKRDAADQNRAVESKDDKVIHVSKPYLEREFLD